MHTNDMRAADVLVKAATAGGFVGMVTVGMVLWTDASAIGTMFNAADSSLLASLFLAGAMIKGAVVGAAFGTALPVMTRIRGLRPAIAGRKPSQQD